LELLKTAKSKVAFISGGEEKEDGSAPLSTRGELLLDVVLLPDVVLLLDVVLLPDVVLLLEPPPHEDRRMIQQMKKLLIIEFTWKAQSLHLL
jgi:hypothetical protein